MPNTDAVPSDDDLLSVEQAAEELHITPRAVRHRVLAGTLTAAHKMPGRTGAYLFRRGDLAAAIETQSTGASA